MATLLFMAFVAAVLWCAWPSTSGPAAPRRARWWLVGTIALIPWLAWLYWVPRGVRYRLRRRRRLYKITVPIAGGVLLTYTDRSMPYGPDRRAHRRQRRQAAQHPQFQVATPTQYRNSVRFWEECQRSGTPAEQAVAPQMLAFLAEEVPVGIALFRPPTITPDVIEQR